MSASEIGWYPTRRSQRAARLDVLGPSAADDESDTCSRKRLNRNSALFQQWMGDSYRLWRWEEKYLFHRAKTACDFAGLVWVRRLCLVRSNKHEAFPGMHAFGGIIFWFE